jgi:DNA-binding transcriptional ArsR family regulator
MNDRRPRTKSVAFVAILLIGTLSVLSVLTAPVSAQSNPELHMNLDQLTAKADVSSGASAVVTFSGAVSLTKAKGDSGTISAEVVDANGWTVSVTPDKFGPATGDDTTAFTGAIIVPWDTVQGTYHMRVTADLNVPSSDPPVRSYDTLSIQVITNRVQVGAPTDFSVYQSNSSIPYVLSFKVTNIGTTDDKFSFEITDGLGLRDFGWSVDLFNINDTVVPDAFVSVNINISIPAHTSVGTYGFTLTVSSEKTGSTSSATAHVTVMAPVIHTPQNGPWSFLGLGYVGWTIVSIAIVGCFMMVFVGGTEVGYFAFLIWVFVPLYCRIMKEKVLDNFTRGEIYGYIKANPGAHYMELQNQLDLPNGVLAHHLMVLEREEFVKVDRDGFYKRFYPRHAKIINREKHLSRIQKQLMVEVNAHPGISQKTLASYLDESKQVISYHIRVLSKAGILRVEKEGSVTKVYSTKRTKEPEVEEVHEVEEVLTTKAGPTSAGPSEGGSRRIGPGHIGRI